VIGETYNPSGNWSSYPPHKHEREVPGLESKHEEVYYFRMNPAQGFALMRLYQDEGRDQAVVVEDGDTVLLPNGYHPVVAAPGYQAYYLWILAGEKRALLMHDDPKHAWVKKQ
jgi:5-deoxy-glucuronate isomerase